MAVLSVLAAIIVELISRLHLTQCIVDVALRRYCRHSLVAKTGAVGSHSRAQLSTIFGTADQYVAWKHNVLPWRLHVPRLIHLAYRARCAFVISAQRKQPNLRCQRRTTAGLKIKGRMKRATQRI